MTNNEDRTGSKTTHCYDKVPLEPTSPKSFGCIGWVETLYGAEGPSVDGFRPTVFELQQLARYWKREWWDIRLFEFYTRCSGSSDARPRSYANWRLGRIREAIGEEALQEAVDEVGVDVRKRIGDEDFAAITGDDDSAYERRITRSDMGRERLGDIHEAEAKANQR